MKLSELRNLIREEISKMKKNNDIPSTGDMVKVMDKENKILDGTFRFVGKVGSKAKIQKLSGNGQKVLGEFIFPMDSVIKM